MATVKKVLLILVMIIFSMWAVQSYQSDVMIVCPNLCKFEFDDSLSFFARKSIQTFIDAQYKKDKNPQKLLSSVEENFPYVKAVTVDMNNPDFFQCIIQVYNPLFLLNGESVICQGGRLFDKDIFSKEFVGGLENILFTFPLGKKDLKQLSHFVESLPVELLQNFSIRWLGKNSIWLDQKEGLSLSLLVGHSFVPTMDDVNQCRLIKEQITDKTKKMAANKTWVCDLRFAQQIVLFSKNKGD